MVAGKPGTAVLASVLVLFASTLVWSEESNINYQGADFNDGSCSDKKLKCDEDALCMQNMDHSRFKCYCPEGFLGDGYLSTYKAGAKGCTLDGYPVKCRYHTDCHVQASCMPFGITGHCHCNSGFTGDGAIDNGCQDIDECPGNPCAKNAICTNSPPGSYTCKCDSQQNYEGDGYSKCHRVCYSAQDCGKNARCEDWKCTCDDGFYGDGITCTDINECENGQIKCPEKSVCQNTPGSYDCLCINGFMYKEVDNICVPYFKTCDQMYKATKGMPSGRYTLDFDGEGPQNAVEVWCSVKQGFAVTELSPIIPFPLPMLPQGQEVSVPYPVPAYPLIANSDFCSQEVWMKCTGDYDGGRVQWVGADGKKYTGWGGNGNSSNCACGDVGKCPGGCYCANGKAGEDWGLIIKKSALPLTKVIIPRSSKGGNPGNVNVGRLRCGPNSFDIPKDCYEAKFKYNIRQDTAMFIDIDGLGSLAPILVYCDQESYSHVGIIQIAPDKPQVKKTTSSGQPLDYNIPGPALTAIIEGSVFCSQRVQYRCKKDTMMASGVQVTSRSGLMTYFPGGSKDKPGSCGCGITNSCDSSAVQCNCNIEDGKTHTDFGLIIDSHELPILHVRTTADDNIITIGALECSQKQFGVEPNCEKYRQANNNQTYTYLIDSDGPAGYLAPFPVECEMDEFEGVTVVNNEGGDNMYLEEGKVFNIHYLQSTPQQLAGLKVRSTVCVQQLIFSGCGAQGTVNIGGFTYNLGRPLSEQLARHCPANICPCDVPLIVSQMVQLPIVKLKGAGVSLDVGALKCKEIYPDCESYNKFLVTKGVEGEKLILLDKLTIDPDGADDGKSFVVNCKKKQTIISPPTTTDKPLVKITPNTPNPGEVCFKMNYTDARGVGIPDPQMDALMDSAKNCAQTFKLMCSNAMGTGMVKYRNCAGKEFTSFVSKEVEATCACGATGTCEGGADDGCNCDSGKDRTVDLNWIISNHRLPICEVCVRLEDISGGGAGVPQTRQIKFEVSGLTCGIKQGRKATCQKYRLEKKFDDLKKELQDNIWMDTSTDASVIVGCKFLPEPQVGTMIIRPEKPVYIPDKDFTKGNITIIYRGFSITSFREVTHISNYCTQDLLFFCAEKIPNLTGSYGLWSGVNRLNPADYELRELTAERKQAVCSDDRFSARCKKCSQSPKLLVVTNKDRVPVSMVILPPTSPAHLAVDDVSCAYIEKDCDTILKANKVASDVLPGGYYLEDPDQAGPVPPFKVFCNFLDGHVGISVVPSDNKWSVVGVGGDGGKNGATFRFNHTYPTATPEQINSLTQNSDFCWQGVKYRCQDAPLASSTLQGFKGQSLTSFGTGDDTDVIGCACGVLGTCVTSQVTCNCDSQGSMVDQGFLTDKDILPVTGFHATYKPSGNGKLTVTDVRCGPIPTDLPRDCSQASEWRTRNGIDYTKSGEILISPNPAKVRPFLISCDMTDPLNPITMIKPEPTKDVPVGKKNPEVHYQGPSIEQISAILEVSAYCYQPVKVDCFSASFLKAGVKAMSVLGRDRTFWAAGTAKGTICTCGTNHLCGGTLSLSAQKLTNCNCDIGDDEWRSDAAILDVKKSGPLGSLLTAGIFDPDKGHLSLTVGDVFCAQKPIEFNECAIGFHDCAEKAVCIDEPQGYRCECPLGWTGKSTRSSSPDLPMANGRQCIDDDECTLSNKCLYNSVCQNTPGSYRCVCNPGYRQVDDFTCEDVNECVEGIDDCDVNARCINTDGSFQCRCLQGYRGSGHKGKCRAVGQCGCFGDPHCQSYDGKWNHYQGLCSYIMASTNCSTTSSAGSVPASFLVTTRNWDHDYVGSGHYAWVKEVVVQVYGKTIKLGQGMSIAVDGENKRSYSMMSPDGKTLLLSVYVAGTDVAVFTDFGLEVTWDGDNEVTVYTPTTFRNRTCGLCGNFNQNPSDDWEVGPACPSLRGKTTKRQALFGNSWTYNLDTCPVNCNPREPDSTCDSSMTLVRKECSKLFTMAAFAECIKKMTPIDLVAFNDSCVYDLCHSDSPSDSLCDFGMSFAGYCSELLASVIVWKTAEMCGEESCDFMECTEPNSHCVDGECVCLMGFTADCHQCVDIDECAIGEHNCKYLGQRCDNTPGSFQCGCLEGFVESGDFCKNINECDDPKTECPDHAECYDFPGGYECVCCLGYIMKEGQCIRDSTQDAVYGAPGSECCACTGIPCSDPQPVCGTDGQSYANYKAMVVTACKDKRHVEVDYPGHCAESCEPSPCDKPFQTCSVQNGTATCSCPSCAGGDSSLKADRVCGSNNRVYPSECAFQTTMCETGNRNVSIESSMEPCRGGGVAPVGPWSEWSECDNHCGMGTSRRTREALMDTNYPLEEEIVCYTVCNDGPCQIDTCLNPGQVCQVVNTPLGETVAQCVCPDCRGQPETPVCGLVGRVVRTYQNPCLLQQKGCELIQNYTVLEERACEDKPKDCAAVRNFAMLNDTQGCVSLGSQDVGECYGGCGSDPSLCCLPIQKDPPEMVTLTFRCPDGSHRIKQHEKITACECVELP